MSVIPLTSLDLVLAASLVLALGLVVIRLRLGVAGSLWWSATRMAIQLLLVGLILEKLFATRSPWWVALMAFVMLAIAGREVQARQKKRFARGGSYLIGTSSMMVSSFTITLFALNAVIDVDPWYTPQYAIPVLGMLLGNTMTGVALACERLTSLAA
ncbi:MAG: ABC transporter permease, partial [Planctomycetes bacterium]|nr:ABC transporter permease [Planctomycetota bacterium]